MHIKIITEKQIKKFMRQLEKDYDDKPLLSPKNEREYWLFTEVWERCNGLFNSLKEIEL